MPAPPGIRPEDWDATKAAALAVLIARAKRRTAQTISYSELAGRIGPLEFDAHDKIFHNMLGELSVEQYETNLGMISVLVVHQPPSDLRPGPGFYKLARDLRPDAPADDEQLWVEEFNRVLDAHR